MIPSTYRNVSGISIRVPEFNDLGVLFDCGEGSYG